MTTQIQEGDRVRVVNKDSRFYGQEGVVSNTPFIASGSGMTYFVGFNKEPEAFHKPFDPDEIEKVVGTSIRYWKGPYLILPERPAGDTVTTLRRVLLTLAAPLVAVWFAAVWVRDVWRSR